ncbi:MAG TPA: CotH kinase family protein [Chryseolinea sp.]|nr:CotH kinase family protein [Chryseolinea sp.]
MTSRQWAFAPPIGYMMKTLCVFHFVFLAIATALSGQSVDDFRLNKPTQTNLINTVSFVLPAVKVTQLHRAKGEKLDFKVPVTVINGDSISTKHVHIRGTTSSYLRRKSLNIKLNKKAVFYARRDTFSLKKFYAISMSMDRNYIRNKIACEVLDFMDVKVPANSYANLLVNNITEGLYMIFDPPEQFAMKSCDASLVIRRGYGASIDKLEYEGISKKESVLLRHKFQSVYNDILGRYHGEQLYQKLEEVLDMNGYFVWLAFNHLFQNGDYADELYLMWNNTKNRFEILPWDFDDLLHSNPHEGLEQRNNILHDKLIFSSEDVLDVAIANDEFLYMKYLQCYKQFLEKLTPVVLSEILNGIYQEVYPYYLQPAIIAQSQYDQGGLTDLVHLETDIRNIDQSINAQVVTHLGKVNALLKQYASTAK